MKSCPDCTASYPDDYAICPKDGAPLTESTIWQIGTVIRSRYRILARLGEGGMATVYKAHHELLDELRALKVIRPELVNDAEFMGRFKNEAIMARRLNHPNAVRVHDLDIAEDGLPFIAMELVVGDTLKTLIQRAGALPVSLVLDISFQVCEALDAAHKLGLIHRDIKPENIVLVAQRDGPPVAKILDFGISRLRDEIAGAKGLTRTGMVIGTPEYMSPEQAMGKKAGRVDGRSDLYSLGIVMYRMLTGELPFYADETVVMIMHQLRTPATPPHEFKPGLGIPEAVSKIVMKALEKDREKRFATGGEMAAAIKKARGSITLSSRKVDWDALSSAPATFGSEVKSFASDPGQVPVVRPAVSPDRVAESPPKTSRPMYRTSARVAPLSRGFPRGLVVKLAVLMVLGVAVYFGWRNVRWWLPSGQVVVAPSGSRQAESPATVKGGAALKTLPVNATSQHGAPKPSEVSTGKTGTPGASPASSERAAESKTEKFDQQARIKELNNLAAIYLRQGGCEKAMPLYEQVLALDPGNQRAWRGMQNCYAKANKPPPPEVSPDP